MNTDSKETEQQLNHEKIQAEIANLTAQSIKAGAETAKVNKDIKWYEIIITVTATLAIAAIAKIFL